MKSSLAENNISIREFRRADLAAIAELEALTFPHDAMPPPTFVQLHELFPKTSLVAEADDRIVGYTLVAQSGDEPCKGLVIALGVHPDWRQRGVGTRLASQVMERSGQVGLQRLELTVSPGNVEAVRLYEKMGFRQAGEVAKDYFGPGEDRLRMTAQIPGCCIATDDNLQAEASTSVAWSNLLAAIAGAALAGLLAAGSLELVAYWYVVLSLLGSLYSSQFYANVSGVVARLRRSQNPERLLTIGNAVSEYLAFYPMVLALPLIVAVLTSDPATTAVATLADLLMFGFYQLSRMNVESRQSGTDASVLSFILMSAAAAGQVIAFFLVIPALMYTLCVVATLLLVLRTLQGIRSVEQ